MTTVTKTKGRLKYIEPNDLAALYGVKMANGKAINSENSYVDNVSWDPEEMNMSVDLQVVMPNREDCGQISFNNNFAVEINNDNSSAIGRYVSFLQGSGFNDKNGNNVGNELTTSYTDASYMELRNNNESNKECIGIESIDITFDSHFYPQVNIKFIDVRGYSLMMPTEYQYRETLIDKSSGNRYGTTYNNFFRALFRFPYPRFLLTIKGYYGNHITFMLSVNEFKNNFNSSTGNFEVNVSFIGYMYGLYTDLPFNFLICAPYYHDGTQKDGEATRDYWKNFHFDNGEGDEGKNICTFIEFLKLFDELNKTKKDIEKAKTNNSDLNNVKNLSNNVDTATNLVSDIHKFINDIIEQNKSFTHIKHFNNLKRITQLLVIGNSTNDKVYFNKDKYNDIVDKFNSFVESESIMGISVGDNYTIMDDFRDSENLRHFKKFENNYFNLDENTYFIKDGDKIVKKNDSFEIPDKEDTDDIFSKFESNSDRAKGGIRLFYFDSVITVLNNYVTEANNKIEEKKLTVDKVVTDIYVEALGFDPSIQNVFRMIFAHIDCFMDEFYNLLKEIKNSNRTLSEIGITNKNLTDLNKNSTENCFVPPFTAFYKEDDNRRVEVYPGELEIGENLKEVEFIEKFLSGALSAKNTSKTYIQDSYNNRKFEEENDNGLTNKEIKFYITSLSDSNFNGVNPYSYFDESPSEKQFLGGLLYYFALRYAQSKFQFGDFTLDNASIEAQNFLELHKSVPSFRFKKTLEEYCGDKKDKLLDVLSEFVNNRNNLVCDITVNKDNVKISKSKLPLFTKGIVDSNSEKVLFSEKNKNKKLFDIWGPERYGDVENIRNSATEDINGRIFPRPGELDDDVIDGISNGSANAINPSLSADTSDGNKINVYNLVDDNRSDKEKAAHFLYCLMHNIAKVEQYTGASGAARKIYVRLSFDLNKTSIGPLYNVTAAFIGAILGGYYHDKAQENGSLYYIRMGTYNAIDRNDVQTTYEFYVVREQYDTIRDNYKQFFIDSFEDFVKNDWPGLNRRLVESNFEVYKDTNTHYMKDNLRKYIVENLLKDKYRYIYNVCDEYDKGKDEIEIWRTQFQNFVNKLYNAYSSVKSIEETVKNDVTEADITNSYKLEAYNAMKNIYDKWANSYVESDFKLRTPLDDRNAKTKRYVDGNPNVDDGVKEYDNFVFIDSFYNDISYRFRINPSTMYDIIVRQMNNEINYSVYEFMAEICQQNKLLFLALPVINNFYDEDGLENIFKPRPEYMMDKGFGSTYVCMYTYEVSHVVEDESQTGLCDDGFDIAEITEDAGQTDIGLLFNKSMSGMPLSVPAFGVTYARQNQQYFRNISVNMDNPRVTDYSIANLFELANFKNDGTLEKTHTVANDIYSIYANRSYNCSVEMLGCANIMPMMYFQLNNIPMFRGGYMITNVEHHIKAGNFTTTFTGVRISKNQLPYNDVLFEKTINWNFENGFYGNDQFREWNGVNVECTEFNVHNAIESMKDNLTFDKCPQGVQPLYNRKSCSGCVKAVKYFVAKGLGVDISELGSWGNGYRGGEGNNPPISKCGFVYEYSFPAGSTREKLKILSSQKSKAGDVAFMRNVSNDNEDGHVCMYNGENWVSDFNQDCVYVYFKFEQTQKTSREIRVFRHESCKEVNVESSVDDNGSNYKVIAKGLMDAFGFKKEQIIGIMSSIYQESKWNPRAVNPKSTARGIAQWMCSNASGCRQKGICDYINGKYYTKYQPVRKGDINDMVNFIDMPLKYQVEGLINELNSIFIRKLSNLKNSKTAVDACDSWTKYIEGANPDDAHRKWINNSRNEYNLAFGNS